MPFRLLRLLLPLLIFTGCAEPSKPFQTATRPVEPTYLTAVPAGRTDYTNDSLARAFTILTHDMEWGSSRPNLVRFEGTVNVAMIGEGSNRYQVFLAEFLRILRKEANIDIRISAPKDADLMVRFVPGSDFRTKTGSQCVVVNGHPDWGDLERDMNAYGADAFERDKTLTKASAIIPNTLEPFKIRECILEEVSQALGTSNDLYALGDTIFNDDDGHTWPTRLDYLMLRVLYDKRMETGLDRSETQIRARQIFDDLNPAGNAETAIPLPTIRQQTFLNWRNRMHVMIRPDGKPKERLEGTQKLLDDAARIEPDSNYHCTAAVLEAYLKMSQETDDALKRIFAAREICRRANGEDDIRIAQLDLIRVRALNKDGRYRDALQLSDRLERIFLANGKERDLITTLAQRAVSHRKLDDDIQRDAAIRKLKGWAAYALGSDNARVEGLRGY